LTAVVAGSNPAPGAILRGVYMYIDHVLSPKVPDRGMDRPSCCGEYMSYESIEWKGLDDKTMHQGQYVCMVCGNRTDFKLKVISGRPPMRRRDHYITDKNTNEK
jgi:hypothetical protein